MMKLTVVFLLLLGMSACSSDKDSSGTNAIFDKATNAVASVSDAVDASTFAPAGCSSGAPTSSSPGDAAYAGELVYCALNSNSKSPDTIQGSYFLVSAVLCAVEKQISFVYDASPTDHDGVTFNESDSCFGTDGFDADESGDTTGTVLLSMQDQALTGSGYDYSISLQLGAPMYNNSNEPNVIFYLKDSDGILAARIYQGAGESLFEFVINTNNNTFYYENRDYDNQRHIRLSAEGVLSPTGSFTSVTSAKYIHGEQEATAGHSIMMNFGASVEEYDHHVNDLRDADYVAIASIPYLADFHSWIGRAITDHNPTTDPILDLSTFNMSF